MISTTVINYHIIPFQCVFRHKVVLLRKSFGLVNSPPDGHEILCDVHLKSDIASPVDMVQILYQHFQVGGFVHGTTW